MQLVTREGWAPRHPDKRGKVGKLVRDTIIVHHSGDPIAHAGEVATVQGIEDFHVRKKEWDGIGYHFLVGPSGTVYEGRGLGRNGAHAPGHNSTSYGVCLLGNFNDRLPPPSQMDGLKALCRWLVASTVVTPNPHILGHRDVRATACPGDALYNVLPSVIAAL